MDAGYPLLPSSLTRQLSGDSDNLVLPLDGEHRNLTDKQPNGNTHRNLDHSQPQRERSQIRRFRRRTGRVRRKKSTFKTQCRLKTGFRTGRKNTWLVSKGSRKLREAENTGGVEWKRMGAVKDEWVKLEEEEYIQGPRTSSPARHSCMTRPLRTSRRHSHRFQ